MNPTPPGAIGSNAQKWYTISGGTPKVDAIGLFY